MFGIDLLSILGVIIKKLIFILNIVASALVLKLLNTNFKKNHQICLEVRDLSDPSLNKIGQTAIDSSFHKTQMIGIDI